MVDDCKNVLPVVTSNIGITLADCIVDVVPVLSFKDDFIAFGVEEVEFSAPFVVLVASNVMFELS